MPSKQGTRGFRIPQSTKHLLLRDELLYQFMDLVPGPTRGLQHHWRTPYLHLPLDDPDVGVWQALSQSDGPKSTLSQDSECLAPLADSEVSLGAISVMGMVHWGL